MTWQPFALSFAAVIALAHWLRWARRQPSDFTQIHKLRRFKQYHDERDEELRRRTALSASHRRAS